MGGWSSPPIVSCCDTFSVLHPLVDAEPIPGGLAGLWGALSHVLMLRGWSEGILKLFAKKISKLCSPCLLPLPAHRHQSAFLRKSRSAKCRVFPASPRSTLAAFIKALAS
jgi:hypothetical protein